MGGGAGISIEEMNGKAITTMTDNMRTVKIEYLSLILFVLIQTATIAWWASGLQAQVKFLQTQFAAEDRISKSDLLLLARDVSLNKDSIEELKRFHVDLSAQLKDMDGKLDELNYLHKYNDPAQQHPLP